jgi:ADP-ribose pyrophosphatase YjhB (NUDIX family)
MTPPNPLLTGDFPGLVDMTEHVVWQPGALEFTVRLVLGDSMPPDHLTTSVRAVVLRNGEVLVMRERDGSCHIVPGGRREPNETFEQTVRREVREESALNLGFVTPIGWLVFDHRFRQEAGYPYPWPRFIQSIYAGRAADTCEPQCTDEWSVEAAFMPIDRARPLLTPIQRLLVDAAVAAAGSG